MLMMSYSYAFLYLTRYPIIHAADELFEFCKEFNAWMNTMYSHHMYV